MPQPEPPTFPTFSAPGKLVALTPLLAAPLAAALPDDSALAAVVLAPCWPGVPLQADITSSAVADRAMSPIARDFLINNPPHDGAHTLLIGQP
jgi:hypothetical protein